MSQRLRAKVQSVRSWPKHRSPPAPLPPAPPPSWAPPLKTLPRPPHRSLTQRLFQPPSLRGSCHSASSGRRPATPAVSHLSPMVWSLIHLPLFTADKCSPATPPPPWFPPVELRLPRCRPCRRLPPMKWVAGRASHPLTRSPPGLRTERVPVSTILLLLLLFLPCFTSRCCTYIKSFLTETWAKGHQEKNTSIYISFK